MLSHTAKCGTSVPLCWATEAAVTQHDARRWQNIGLRHMMQDLNRRRVLEPCRIVVAAHSDQTLPATELDGPDERAHELVRSAVDAAERGVHRRPIGRRGHQVAPRIQRKMHSQGLRKRIAVEPTPAGWRVADPQVGGHGLAAPGRKAVAADRKLCH